MKKEIRENNEARRMLTDEEAEQVSGGATPDVLEEEHSEPADAGCYEDDGAADIGGYEGPLILSER